MEHDSEDSIDLKFPSLEPEIYYTQALTTEPCPDKYYVPVASNNPKFDAFARFEGRRLGFQMSLSTAHSLNSGGLRMLRARLQDGGARDKAMFVFVIRAGRPFKRPAPGGVELDFFDFYTLEMNHRLDR